MAQHRVEPVALAQLFGERLQKGGIQLDLVVAGQTHQVLVR